MRISRKHSAVRLLSVYEEKIQWRLRKAPSKLINVDTLNAITVMETFTTGPALTR
jgi:hypothetical protein